ncbi:MAG TPA: tetratricopeptide repeat protein [Vicinamibacterales bacterium]|nr:tetratricopeptide repeat protein [Vicinamibacterales bacterium]
MRCCLASFLVLTLLAAATPVRAQKIGTVTFPNSGAAAAQKSFLQGIALLHSYEYSDARDAFREARRIDPGFALAAWAEGMTFSHFDWGSEDLPGAQAALARLAPTPEQRLAKAGTPRERAFGTAIEMFLAGDGSPIDRARTFAAAMEAYAVADPSDVEAAAFAARGALYVLRYAPAAEQAQSAERAIALAERVVAMRPEHPGGIHYLIHATDSPRFAAKGLPAARLYDKIAPDAEHALHMPSHIFLQLGMWEDVAASNERSWAASRTWLKRGNRSVAELSWHSLAWLQYAYLQQGRYGEAKGLIDTAHGLLDAVPASTLGNAIDVRYTIDALTFQYAAETGRWDRSLFSADNLPALIRDAAAKPSIREQGMANGAAYHAALASALSGVDPAVIRDAAVAMRGVVTGLKSQDTRRTLLNALATQIEALAATASKDDARAIAILARLESETRDSGLLPLGVPIAVPTSELLGGLLLKTGRFEEAAAVYQRALTMRANRSAALLGLARARMGAGDRRSAADAYRRLLENWKRADPDLPALAEARAAIVSAGK